MPRLDKPEQPRRFYKAAAAGEVDGGFGVLLDGRALRSPAGERLAVPTSALAELLAAEWAGQGETIDLAAMPATKLAFSAGDRVGAHRAETAAEVRRYASSDLLCYFAEGPDALVARQVERWGPMLDWARDELGLGFRRAMGVIPVAQPPATLESVEAMAAALDDFTLAGLAYAAALFGSAILGLAVQRDRLDGAAAFALSRLDEDFQAEQWGIDAEAAQARARLADDAGMIDRWFQALRRADLS